MDTIAPSLARLQQVQVRYRDHTALHGIDLQVRAGQVLAPLGRNGAGKSTAISVLLGLRRADAGQVELLGGDPQQRGHRLGPGAMLQSTRLPPGHPARSGTVGHLLVLLGASAAALLRARRRLRRVG